MQILVSDIHLSLKTRTSILSTALARGDYLDAVTSVQRCRSTPRFRHEMAVERRGNVRSRKLMLADKLSDRTGGGQGLSAIDDQLAFGFVL
jgi:hypothetical protein